MKKGFPVFMGCCLLVLMSCKSSDENKNLSPEEQWVHDSISRVRQKEVNDSLKKRNPLLILPPDSNYSGEYIDKYPGGIVKFKGTYRFGKRHGQWLSFYPSGIRWSEMHYDNGNRQGPNLTFYENGQLRYSGFYKDDQVDSVWCYYDSTGVLAQRLVYKLNRLIERSAGK